MTDPNATLENLTSACAGPVLPPPPRASSPHQHRAPADETRWKGIIIPEQRQGDGTAPEEDLKEFDIDTKVMTDFEACNALWEVIA
jgi:hypothetical protein